MDFPKHFQQAHLPTPIQRAHRFLPSSVPYELWIKRDDFTGIELSGNKVRKLDFLFSEAQSQGAKRVITCGGIQSNHCRATAFYATKMGMKATLVLRGTLSDPATGNLFLAQLLNPDIKLVNKQEYQDVENIMKSIAANSNEPAYIIPEGGSNETGSWGYLKAFYEIVDQDDSFDTIVVPTGSGGTHAGLLLGKLISGSSVNIVSVNVADDAAFFKNKINSILLRFCDRYDFSIEWQKEDIHIIDGHVGKGYALISDKEVDIIRRMARAEGIVLDPVYGAKAMLGLEKNLLNATIPGQKILYILTGGIFGTFPFTDMFNS